MLHHLAWLGALSAGSQLWRCLMASGVQWEDASVNPPLVRPLCLRQGVLGTSEHALFIGHLLYVNTIVAAIYHYRRPIAVAHRNQSRTALTMSTNVVTIPAR